MAAAAAGAAAAATAADVVVQRAGGAAAAAVTVAAAAAAFGGAAGPAPRIGAASTAAAGARASCRPAAGMTGLSACSSGLLSTINARCSCCFTERSLPAAGCPGCAAAQPRLQAAAAASGASARTSTAAGSAARTAPLHQATRRDQATRRENRRTTCSQTLAASLVTPTHPRMNRHRRSPECMEGRCSTKHAAAAAAAALPMREQAECRRSARVTVPAKQRRRRASD